MDKKQKIVVAALAVVALGAGGYFVLREPPSEVKRQAATGRKDRKERKAADSSGSLKDKRAARKVARSEKVSEGRKKRIDTSKGKKEGRKTRGRRTKKEKKEKITPAA